MPLVGHNEDTQAMQTWGFVTREKFLGVQESVACREVFQSKRQVSAPCTICHERRDPTLGEPFGILKQPISYMHGLFWTHCRDTDKAAHFHKD